MNNKFIRLIGLIVLVSGLLADAAAAETLSTVKFTASVMFGGGDPIITHQGLTQLSPTSTADIAGQAAATDNLSRIYVDYYVDTQANQASVSTMISEAERSTNFNFSIPVNMSGNPSSFYYRISAVDASGRVGHWPLGGGFFQVPLQSLQILAQPLEQVSPVTKVAVASGQIVSHAPLSSVEMFYRTDEDTDYRTVKKNIGDTEVNRLQKLWQMSVSSATNTQTYNFRLETSSSIQDTAKYFYYYIRATDNLGHASVLPVGGGHFQSVVSSSKTIALSTNSGSVKLPDGNPEDGQTSVEIPSRMLRPGTSITITELSPSDPSVRFGNSPAVSAKPLSVYRFTPEGITFSEPVKMSLLYQDRDDNGIVDGTDYRVNSLKIMWWDGLHWTLVGGKVDPKTKLVSAQVRHFSMYGLFSVPTLRDDEYRPKNKIITPNGDGINDFASFNGLGDDDIVNIFDVNGKRIRQLKGNSIWDGRDDGRNMVESGIYIYQIKTAGKTISGTIAVAK